MADENTTANLDPFAAYAVPSQKSNTDDFGKFIDDTLGGTPIGAVSYTHLTLPTIYSV